MLIDNWENRKQIKNWYEKSNTTWGQVLDNAATKYGNVEAIIYNNERINYKQLKKYVDSFARGLLEIGVKSGDNVGLWMTNCPEWIISQFAIFKIGARMVAINTRYRLSEIEYVLSQSECKAIVMKDVFFNKINALEILDKIIPDRGNVHSAKGLNDRNIKVKNVVCLSESGMKYKGTYDYNDVIGLGDKLKKDGLLKKVADAVSPSDILYIQYTSGTTGFPKGVMCTHRSIVASMFCCGVGVGYRKGKDRMIVALPLYTNYGALGCSASNILFGLSMILVDQFDPEMCLRLIEREKVTITHGSDTMYIKIMKDVSFGKYNISTLRGGIMGGGSNPPEVVKEVMKMVPEITMVYGLTENSGFGTLVLYDDLMEKRLYTSGREMPYTHIRIQDPKDKAFLPYGKEGEICAHDSMPNSSVMLGYYKKEKETKDTIDNDGWLHTGDLGYFDEDGFLIVSGRIKDMFITSGNNVYPAEIENYLYKNSLIKEVAVVGVPDSVKGAVPMAYVMLKEGVNMQENEIIEFCKDNIASYKVPVFVEFVKELPMTPSGKIQKFILRENAIKKYGLEEIAKERKL